VKYLEGNIMKIVMITMDRHAGVLHYTSQLSEALSRNNQVSVITPVGVDKSLFDRSVKLISIPVGNDMRNAIINTLYITRMFNFLKVIQKEDPDIIHFQTTHNFWASIFLPLLRKYKIVTTLHEVGAHFGFSYCYKNKIARRLHLKYSHGLIVHGEKEKKKLMNLGVKKRCYIIPHGEYSFFMRYGREGIKERDAILFFGRIHSYKGLEYLLKAEPLITKELPNTKIIIAGEGDLKSYDKLKIATHNIEIYNKFIPNGNVSEFFQMSKVIVLPYIEASQSGIIHIAFAFKKPVVATNVGCIPEVVEDGKTGFIVPPRNPEALAEAIIKLLKDDELRKEMGENAYKKTKEELSWDKIAEKTIEVYEDILNTSKHYNSKVIVSKTF
jgi:glycosyltransferase involved in cell wall biosynthesis